MKFRKFLATALIAAMTACLFAGCGSKKDENANDATVTDEAQVTGDETGDEGADASENTIDMSGVTLINDGVLTIGAEIGYPPFEDFADDGTTPVGFDVDFAKALGEKLGVDVNFINTSFDGILGGIGVNYDVVISAVTINDERKENCLFSTPYITNYQAVVVSKDSDLKVSSFNDLDGKIIAFQKGTTSDDLMNDYKETGSIDCTMLANEQVLSCFTQLDNGEIDAVVVDSTVADGYVGSNPDKYEIAFKDESEPEEFGVAMGLEDTELQAVINEAIEQIKADGTFDELIEYWFGSQE